MTIWLDAHISPAIGPWLRETFGVQAQAVRDLGLREAKDKEIFMAAQQAGVVIMSKDSDFIPLLEQMGIPPQILWITCGNTSNIRLKEILTAAFRQACNLLQQGEPLVEISDAQ